MTRNKRKFSQRFLVCLSCSCSLLAGGEADSVELEAQFSAGVGKSDNIARTSVNEIEETIGVAGIIFGLTEETSRLSADIRSQFDYLYFADGTFDDEWVGGMVGILAYSLVDERLTWFIQNNFGQQTVDLLSASNPGNRENVNFFTTGPTLSLLPDSRNLVEIDLRYSSVSYEESDTDNERMLATLRIGRQIRRGATLSLNATTERVEFDNDGLSRDFDRHEGYVRYELAGNRNTFGMDLGYTQIDIDGETGDGTLARIDWSREVSPSATFRLSAGTGFSDQGNVFVFDQQQTGSDFRDTEDTLGSAEPFTFNNFTISYSLDRDRTSVGFVFTWSQEDYEGGPLDNDFSRATLSVRRNISPSVFARFVAEFRRREYKDSPILNDDYSVAAEIGYRFSPSSSVSLQYRLEDRNAADSFFTSRENRLFLRFSYTPAWGR
jgi:hypothetical protein